VRSVHAEHYIDPRAQVDNFIRCRALRPKIVNVMKEGQPKRFEIAPDIEVRRRAREIQLLLNVAEPDPEYQPLILTDEASVFDAVGNDEDEIRRRFELYFGEPLPADLRLPLWRLVDAIRAWRPGWPEEEE
jgi:hypothetical protein